MRINYSNVLTLQRRDLRLSFQTDLKLTHAVRAIQGVPLLGQMNNSEMIQFSSAPRGSNLCLPSSPGTRSRLRRNYLFKVYYIISRPCSTPVAVSFSECTQLHNTNTMRRGKWKPCSTHTRAQYNYRAKQRSASLHIYRVNSAYTN